MYSTRPGLILAFHGCDKSVADKVISGHEQFRFSKNSYDWLGHGGYFWDSSPSRALEFAEYIKFSGEKSSQGEILNPAVIGAVLNLGFCFDLLDYANLEILKSGHEFFESTFKSAKLPENKTGGSSEDLLLRYLDCAVIESIHQVRKNNNLPPFDSVRGVFWEGNELYPNAGFRKKNHIQICIRNPNCIKGYFLPRKINSGFNSI